jgi:hypothetical protein
MPEQVGYEELCPIQANFRYCSGLVGLTPQNETRAVATLDTEVNGKKILVLVFCSSISL